VSFLLIDELFNKKMLNASLGGITVVLENIKHDSRAGAAFLACYQLPVPVTQATLGDGGCDLHSGIYQININYPEGKGLTACKTMADTLNAIFYSGATFTESTVNVRIKTTSVERAIVAGGYVTLPLSIEYYAHIERV